MSSLIILDFETTGLNPERDQILEMAMVALEYGTLREVAAVSTCLNVPSGVFGLCDDRAHADARAERAQGRALGPSRAPQL
jgi:oligoribonuclease (3'-5' exoribonuclease)